MTYALHLLPDESECDDETWPLWDPLLRLHDAAGGLVAFDDDDGEGRAALLRFTAKADGEMFVSAGGAAMSTGAYRLAAEVAPPDIPGDWSTEARLAPDAAAEGEIGTRTDQDWFRMAAIAGEVWRIEVPADDAGLDPLTQSSLAVYDPACGPMHEAGGGPVFLRASRDGDHFLAVSGSDDLGRYRIAATLVADDHPGGAAATARLAEGASQTGAINYAGDEDWFRATLRAGATYRFDLAPDAAADDPLDYGTIALRDAAGAFIDCSHYSEPLFFTADAHRDVFVAAGEQGDLGAYRLSMSAVEDDIPGDASTPLTLVEGVATGGRVDWPADADWFGFAPVAGTVYRFDVEPDETTDDPLYGRALRLRDATGAVVAEADYGPIHHRATSCNPLFLSAEGRDGDIGAYRLSVSTVADDVPDDASTDAVLAPGEARAGLVGWPGDEDWFRVSVEAGVVYRFDAQPDGSAEDPLDYRTLRVFDAAGTLVESSDWDAIHLRAMAEGALFFSVSGFYDDVGGYVASVAEIEDAVADGVGTDAVLGAGAPVASALDYPGDADWFRLDLSAGMHRIDLAPDDSGGDPLDDARLRLHDETGAVMSVRCTWSGPVFVDAAATGAAFLSVVELYGDRGGYRLAASPVRDDVPGDADTTRSLAVGATTDGAIDFPGDADWFRVDLAPGGAWRFDLLPVEDADAVVGRGLKLLDASGAVLAETGDGVLAIRAATGDEAFVAVSPPFPEEIGAYRLALAPLADDTPDDAATTRVLAPGADASGVIEFPGDRDWFALAVEAGRTYRVVGAPDDSGGDPLYGRRLSLHDASRATLAESGWDSPLIFTGPAVGTVFVAAWSEYDTGAYRLAVELPDDDLPSDASTPTSLALGGEASGTVDFEGDSDWFRIDLDAGETYGFEASTAAWGRLALHDATGAEVAASYLDSPLVFSPATGGAYFVDVQSDAAGEAYTLRAERLPDDAPGSVATAAALAAGGAATGAIEFGGDEDWFRISAAAGVIYRFTVAPDAAAADPAEDPRLALYDAQGALITERWVGEPLSHLAASDGDLYVSVRGDDHGAYRVSAEKATDDIAGGRLDGSRADGRRGAGGRRGSPRGRRLVQGLAPGWAAVSHRHRPGQRSGRPVRRRCRPGRRRGRPDRCGQRERHADLSASFRRDGLRDAVRGLRRLGRLPDLGRALGGFRGRRRADVRDHRARSDADGSDRLRAFDRQRGRRGLVRREARGRSRLPFQSRDARLGDRRAGLPAAFNACPDGHMVTRIWVLVFRKIRHVFSPTESKEYFVGVSDYYQEKYWGVGDYELSMSIVEDALPADATTPATLSLGETYAGFLKMPGDADWVRVELEAGGAYAFSVTLQDATYDWERGRLRLINAWGVEIASGVAALAYASEADQTVFLEASSEYGYSSGGYVLSLGQAMDAAPADTSTTATLAPGEPASGSIDLPDDADWFRVVVEAGKTYRFDLSWAGDAVDPYAGSLTLRAASGARLADAGRQLLYSAPETGVVYVSAAGALGDYALSMTDISDAVAGSVATMGEIAVGGAVAGAVDFAGDQDWFRLAVEAGETYRVELAAADDDLYRPMARVFDADGVLIAEDTGSGWNEPSRSLFTAKSDGFAFVSAGAYHDGYDYGDTGGYALSVDSVPDGPHLLADAPAYYWHHGCCPTAGATLVGYWDQRGYGDLFDAVTAEEVRLTGNVQDQISSPEHNAKYDPRPDDETLPTPETTSIAGFMGTSIDWLDYGATDIDRIAYGLEGYAAFRGYDFDASTEWFSTGTAARFVDEIMAERPVLLVVDLGWATHCIPAIGFEDRGEEGLWYAAYTTWSESETPIWEEFRPWGNGDAWSVVSMTTFAPRQDPVLLADADAIAPMAQIGDRAFAGASRTLEDIRDALGADGLFDAVDAAIFAEAEASGRFAAETDMFATI